MTVRLILKAVINNMQYIQILLFGLLVSYFLLPIIFPSMPVGLQRPPVNASVING